MGRSLVSACNRDTLDEWSFTGAPTQVGGQVWPAISQLLTWGYMRSRPDLAWRSLNRNTFAAHASVFPPSWFNIWTGPDATNCHGSPNPGGAWVSPLTPMTDFPAMNANPDAMALLRDEPDVFPFVNHEFHLQCIARTVTSCLTPSDFDRILTRV